MIRDRDIAKQLIDTLDDCSQRINETIRLVQENCSDEEFRAYRKAAGFVMGYIYTDVVAQLYKEHPDMEPPELKTDTHDD